MKVLEFIDRSLTSIVWGLLVLMFTIMLGLATVQVFLRGAFHTGILWGDVAARHLVIWVGFLGAFLATRGNKHFHIDVLTRFLHPHVRLWFNAFSDLFAAAICYLMMQSSITFLTVGMDPESVLFLGIPQRYLAMIVPGGFGLIMVQFIIRTIESVVAAIRGVREEDFL